jgi:hypothetical protein
MSIGQVELKLTNFNHFTHSWHSLRWWVKPSFNICVLHHQEAKNNNGFLLTLSAYITRKHSSVNLRVFFTLKNEIMQKYNIMPINALLS